MLINVSLAHSAKYLFCVPWKKVFMALDTPCLGNTTGIVFNMVYERLFNIITEHVIKSGDSIWAMYCKL